MTSHQHVGEDRLIDLAARLLPPPLEAETLRHLESCPECETLFRETCRGAELSALRRAVPRGVPRWRWAAVAASLILVVALIGVFSRRSAPVDAAEYWFPVDSELVGLRTGAPGADDDVFHSAVEAYRRHDAALVVGLLSDRSIPEALDPMKIVLASAFVKTGQSGRAKAVLAELRIDTLPQPDRDRARWILFAALTGGGKPDEARTVAESLAARPGEFSESAQRALAALRKSDQ